MFQEIADLFYQQKNENQAMQMAAYMKNNFSFLGIPKPLRSKLENEYIKTMAKHKKIDWDLVKQSWDMPEREYQYFALDYLLRMKKYLQQEDIDELGILITSKSWWDTVDLISASLVGQLCSHYPELMQSHILHWAGADNLWLRRTALLFQLKYKESTHRELLSQIILMNKDGKEFFINKAIGWALREYSKSNPQWVRDFIANHSLHPLAVREGSKYCRG